MKNFLVFLLGLLINALYMYVLFPIFIVGIMAWLWVPLLFRGTFIIGIVITTLTLVVTVIVDYKLESVN